MKEGVYLTVLDLIDTRQGTNNDRSFSHGNTLPSTTTPFGMNAFVPQTRLGDVRFFNSNDKVIYGIRLSHQPSPWMGDFAFIIFNFLGLNDKEEVEFLKSEDSELVEKYNKSSFNPDHTVFKPHNFSYRRLRDRLEVELIPTDYGASLRAGSLSKKIYFTLGIAEDGNLTVSDDGKELRGYTNQLSGSKYGKFGMYFIVKSKDCKFELVKKSNYVEDEHPMEMYWLKVKGNETIDYIELDVTTSYIDLEQADINYSSDIFFTYDWESKEQNSSEKWLEYLDKITVKHSNLSTLKTFYSCLYRTATFPQRAYEIKDENIIHYSPYTAKIEKGYFYLNNGYWDTFRTNYPLYSIIIPDSIPKFIEGILNISREDKYLPKWVSPDERGLMPGTLVDAVIADATVKGLLDREIVEELLEAMIFNATTPSDNELEGRENAEFYFDNGYIPSENSESVNLTLDYSYSDFCIGQVANYLDRGDIAEKYYKYSLNYRNLFDSKSNLMKPRNLNGEHLTDISNYEWGGSYTEGSSWQSSFSVFHNIEDLIKLHGGDEPFYQHVLELINSDPIFEVGDYGQEIHEMSEMAALQFGQLAISNQPSFHIPHLFIYAGYPQISHLILKQLMMNTFKYTADGFPGDDDNGSMSAWYVLNSLGLYQVTPGTDEFVLGISIWDEAVVKLHNNNSIVIKSDPQEPYLNVVESRMVNNIKYDLEYIKYEKLMSGVIIEQKLGVIPNLSQVSESKRPFSLNKII
ncbi:GH92 family glycosyl hydrolase [Fundicoccus culcitae]|uniref:GH92 family glycosyl hydrolase n=2 Tax=Fundicoccus culcitae TaxID=2969821 RepID=A0ABY5P9Y1_9LACT|nr:GH92 family glycosyl hydrolase [Fundicoccus culcitae]